MEATFPGGMAFLNGAAPPVKAAFPKGAASSVEAAFPVEAAFLMGVAFAVGAGERAAFPVETTLTEPVWGSWA